MYAYPILSLCLLSFKTTVSDPPARFQVPKLRIHTHAPYKAVHFSQSVQALPFPAKTPEEPTSVSFHCSVSKSFYILIHCVLRPVNYPEIFSSTAFYSRLQKFSSILYNKVIGFYHHSSPPRLSGPPTIYTLVYTFCVGNINKNMVCCHN